MHTQLLQLRDAHVPHAGVHVRRMRGTGSILMGGLLGVRRGVVSMARYLGGGHVGVLKASGKGSYWGSSEYQEGMNFISVNLQRVRRLSERRKPACPLYGVMIA